MSSLLLVKGINYQRFCWRVRDRNIPSNTQRIQDMLAVANLTRNIFCMWNLK